MNIWDIIDSLNKGMKVRKIEWAIGVYIHKIGDSLYFNDGSPCDRLILNTNATWEVYKEEPQDVKDLVNLVLSREGKFYKCDGLLCEDCRLCAGPAKPCLLNVLNIAIERLSNDR